MCVSVETRCPFGRSFRRVALPPRDNFEEEEQCQSSACRGVCTRIRVVSVVILEAKRA